MRRPRDRHRALPALARPARERQTWPFGFDGEAMLGCRRQGGGRYSPMKLLLPVARCVAACLLALALAACSNEPMLGDVIAQARPGGRVAFDVVKLDDAVLAAVLARPQPSFRERFNKYLPPPELKIAVGDTVSVVIWEAGANGLFGNSLTELSLPAGASARRQTGEPAAPSAEGTPDRPLGFTASPETLRQLSGAAARGPRRASGAPPVRRPSRAPSAARGWPTWRKKAARPAPASPISRSAPTGRSASPMAGASRPPAARRPRSQHTIERRLAPRALDPQALVVVKRSAANSVSVAGEVVGGKRVALSPGGDRLLQVIAAAGGATAPVHDTFVRLSRGGVDRDRAARRAGRRPGPGHLRRAGRRVDAGAPPADLQRLRRHRQEFRRSPSPATGCH